MKAGQIVEMKSANIQTEFCEIGVQAKNSHKGDRLVFIYVGHQDSGEELDVDQVLRNLGWVPANEISE